MPVHTWIVVKLKSFLLHSSSVLPVTKLAPVLFPYLKGLARTQTGPLTVLNQDQHSSSSIDLPYLTKIATTNRPCLKTSLPNPATEASAQNQIRQPRPQTKMHILNFLRLLLLLLLFPASISAVAVVRIVYTPGHIRDINNTSPLVRRDEITWGPDDETQDACGSDATPQRTDASEFLKLNCFQILDFNKRLGRYTISGYTERKWAKINVKGTCAIAVARKDDSTNDFE